MFEAVLEGLFMVVQWPAVGYLLIGVTLGMFFGAVPGLSGLTGMAILLPFTFGLETGEAFALLLGMYAVTTTSDTLASVLLGVPGTAASQATILDGYPLAQQGHAARALGAAYTVSMVGGVLGAVFLALSLPLVRPLILSFSEPEFFMLAVLGLTMVGALSGSSILKGLGSACLGLLLSMIGYAEFGGIPRYWFGMNYLLDGLPLIPVVLGLFALPELVDLAVRKTSIARAAQTEAGGMIEGMRDAVRHWWLALRCTAIGVYIGMLPGLGGSIVDWVAYGHAVQSAKDKSMFGKGDIRGVIAPESANNAMKGGALLPTIAFAIPGSAAMAILLGAFLIQGLEPGPRMLTERLDVSFSLVWTLAIANILGAALLLAWGNQVAKLTFLPGHFLVPAVVLFVVMGSWMAGNAIGDWVSLLLFGFVGWTMKQGGWSRPPLVLGYILGKIMENGLQIGVQTHGWGMLTRPISLIILALVAVTIVFAIRRHMRDRRNGTAGIAASDAASEDPWMSVMVTGVLFAVFAYAALATIGWRANAALFPLVAAVPGALFAGTVLVRDIRRIAELRVAGEAQSDRSALRGGAIFMAWMVGILLAALLIGQYLALLVFVVLYLRFWGKANWTVVTTYTAGCALFLYLLFQLVVPVIWLESPFFDLFG